MPTFDVDAAQVIAELPPGPRLVVIGSAKFYGADSHTLCQAIAADLAPASLVALTGGMEGVGLTFGRALASARQSAGVPEHLFHLLPVGFGPCDCGVTLGAGVDYTERREVLGRVGHVYLVIEGGPGTVHEETVAAARGVPFIPLARTGGHAADVYPRTARPPAFPAADWELLADGDAPHDRVVAAVGRLVRLALSSAAGRTSPP
jgi:hypothetical protein